jgi:hypothetical protein
MNTQVSCVQVYHSSTSANRLQHELEHRCIKNSTPWDRTPCNPLKLCLLTASCWLLLALFFNPENEGDIFLRNVGRSATDYRPWYPKRLKSSYSPLCAVCRAGYTREVSGQRLGKHVPAATDTNATIEEPCFLCGPCRGVIIKG